MKIPAIRGIIGETVYYITTLNFEQIDRYVVKIEDHFHQSKILQDLIQRSVTNNYINIKDYILKQRDFFFTSIVLAVYDDYPDWQEIRLTYNNEETFKVGLLDFPGNHIIFPVDGQHRVEGIKEALKKDQNLAHNEIGVIFIGHSSKKKDKTRRIFTTLNRYAKPASLRDIIALDEDDTSAIVTRKLIESFDLFRNDRVIDIKNKAIPSTNKIAFTSIIALYQANLEICRYHYSTTTGTTATKKKIDEFLKFRPSEDKINSYYTIIEQFWTSFKNKLTVISDYLNLETENDIRNKKDGGNMLFRPVGILPFVKAVITIKKRDEDSIDNILDRYNDINLELNTVPWKNILWNEIENKMIRELYL